MSGQARAKCVPRFPRGRGGESRGRHGATWRSRVWHGARRRGRPRERRAGSLTWSETNWVWALPEGPQLPPRRRGCPSQARRIPWGSSLPCSWAGRRADPGEHSEQWAKRAQDSGRDKRARHFRALRRRTADAGRCARPRRQRQDGRSHLRQRCDVAGVLPQRVQPFRTVRAGLGPKGEVVLGRRYVEFGFILVGFSKLCHLRRVSEKLLRVR